LEVAETIPIVPNCALISSEGGFGMWAHPQNPRSRAMDSKMMIELGMTVRYFLPILLTSSKEGFRHGNLLRASTMPGRIGVENQRTFLFIRHQ
jgi:hypothetical protein